MAEIIVNGSYTVNVAALSARLQQVYPGVLGVSATGSPVDTYKFQATQLIIHLDAAISTQVRDQLLADVASHNPDSLTLVQQEQVDRNDAKLALAGAQVTAALAAIDADIAGLPTADLAGLRTILGRILSRQRKLVQIVAILIEEELETA